MLFFTSTKIYGYIFEIFLLFKALGWPLRVANLLLHDFKWYFIASVGEIRLRFHLMGILTFESELRKNISIGVVSLLIPAMAWTRQLLKLIIVIKRTLLLINIILQRLFV